MCKQAWIKKRCQSFVLYYCDFSLLYTVFTILYTCLGLVSMLILSRLDNVLVSGGAVLTAKLLAAIYREQCDGIRAPISRLWNEVSLMAFRASFLILNDLNCQQSGRVICENRPIANPPCRVSLEFLYLCRRQNINLQKEAPVPVHSRAPSLFWKFKKKKHHLNVKTLMHQPHRLECLHMLSAVAELCPLPRMPCCFTGTKSCRAL